MSQVEAGAGLEDIVHVLRHGVDPKKPKQSWQRLRLKLSATSTQLLFFKEKSRKQRQAAELSFPLTPATTVKGLPLPWKKKDGTQFETAGLVVSTADDVLIIVASSKEQTAKICLLLEEKLQRQKQNMPSKTGVVDYSRKHRTPSEMNLHLENGCLSFRTNSSGNNVGTPDFTIYLDDTVRISHLDFKRNRLDPEVPISRSTYIKPSDFVHYGKLFNFGFVLSMEADGRAPNVFLFDTEPDKSDWVFAIRHSLLAAKFNLTKGQAQVYLLLEDNKLDKYALKLINQGVGTLSSLIRLDLIEIHWQARKLAMNPTEVERFTRMVLQLQKLVEADGTTDADIRQEISSLNTFRTNRLNTGDDDLEEMIETMRELSKQNKGNEVTYAALLKQFASSRSNLKPAKLLSVGKHLRGQKLDTPNSKTHGNLSSPSIDDLFLASNNKKQRPKTNPDGKRKPLLLQSLSDRKTSTVRAKSKANPATSRMLEKSKTDQDFSDASLVTMFSQVNRAPPALPLRNKDQTKEEKIGSKVNRAETLRNMVRTDNTASLYVWGAVSATGKAKTQPTEVSLPDGIVVEMIVASENNLAVISPDNSLFIAKDLFDKKISFEEVMLPALGAKMQRVLVTAVSFGERHTACIGASHLFTWGTGTRGQLGLGEITESTVPTLVGSVGPIFTGNTNDQVIAVACGKDHTLVQTNEGNVYSMGSCDHGKLGLGYLEEDVFLPKIIDSLVSHTIGQIAAGDTFSLAVTLSGRILYRFGSIGSNTEHFMPNVMRNFPRGNKEIFQISATGVNSMFLLSDDEEQNSPSVFTFGADGSVLGLGKNKPSHEPTVILELEGRDVSSVSCGKTHMMALTKKGDLFAWGRAEYGQIGDGSKGRKPLLRPTQVKSVPKHVAQSVVCGGKFSAGLYLSTDYDFGSGSYRRRDKASSFGQFTETDAFLDLDMDNQNQEKESWDSTSSY